MKATCLVCNEFVEMENWIKTDNDEFGACQGCLKDAKLGRMVRGLPKYTTLSRKSQWYATTEDKPGGWGETPEEALEKAMGEGK